jgi:hypothetical protein
MNYKLISTHLRVLATDTGEDSVNNVVGLYVVTDEAEGTPYFISRDASVEKIWISKESAAEMLREHNAVLASRISIELVADLLDDAK